MKKLQFLIFLIRIIRGQFCSEFSISSTIVKNVFADEQFFENV